MRQAIQDFKSGALTVEDVPPPALRRAGLLVATRASLISAGTERMIVEMAQKSLIGKARARPDLVRRVMYKARRDGILAAAQAVRGRLSVSLPLGYSAAGVVLAVGEEAGMFRVGQLVACGGAGHANHAEVLSIPRNLAAAVPEGVSAEEACYTTVAAIALQGVRLVAPTLGERVVVLGMGLMGQLATQVLQAHGAQVLALDPNPERAHAGREIGARWTGVLGRDDPLHLVRDATAGLGADAVLVTAATSSSEPVSLAGELCREKGRVVVLGTTGMDIPRKPYYEKEISFQVSRSSGPGRYDPQYEQRGHDYPFAYVRWTENRNMQAVLDLIETGRLDVRRLTTHTYPIERATDAYDLITHGREPSMGVVLTYPRPDAQRLTARVELPAGAGAPEVVEPVGLSVIGAGQFARGMLLPPLAKDRRVMLRGLCTATGLTAQTQGKRFGFRFCTADVDELLNDPQTAAVLIATRHDQHAGLVCRALRAGKAVFVEKPLALDEPGLDAVGQALAETGGRLMVGFNRRFAPLSQALRAHCAGTAPLLMTYRVNAGPLAAGDWNQDPLEGGGRLIGESCHFLDLFQFLVGPARPTELYAAGPATREGVLNQDVLATVRYSDGSVATLLYTAQGDPAAGKERLEVHGGGRTACLDDFRRLECWRGGGKRHWTRAALDKGHAAELARFIDAVAAGGAMPIPAEQLLDTTRLTFRMVEALRGWPEAGEPVDEPG